MVTLEHLRKMSLQEKDYLQGELWNLIATGNIAETKNFLKDFRVRDIFYELSFDFETESMFNAPMTLYQALLAYEKTQSFAMLDFLLDFGLEADEDDGESNVLQYYIKLGGVEKPYDKAIIKYLLDKGVRFENIGQASWASGWNIIHKCAHDQKVESLMLMAEFGADMESRGRVYHNNELIAQTPLMIAASSSVQPLGAATRCLLGLGVDINASDRKRTALDYAIQSHREENVEILKNAGAKGYEEL